MKKITKIFALCLSFVMILSLGNLTTFVAATGDGTEANPEVIEKNKMLDNAYLMNTTFEANDSDGHWYTLTAHTSGIFYVSVTSYNTSNHSAEVYVGNDVFTLSKGNPIITYEVKKGTKIRVHIFAGYDKDGSIPACTIYAHGYFTPGTSGEAVPLKSSPVNVPLLAGETIYLIDDSKTMLYKTTDVVLSGPKDVMAKAEVIIGAKSYKDDDGDGKIKFPLGGDDTSMVRPEFAFKNGSSVNAIFTLTVVVEGSDVNPEPEPEPQPKPEKPAHTHVLTHVNAVKAGCHSKGNQEYWYCKDCNTYYLDEACTRATSYASIIIPQKGSEKLVHYEAVKPGANTNGNIEYWLCKECGQVWKDKALTQPINIKDVVLPATGENVKVETGEKNEKPTPPANNKNDVESVTSSETVDVENETPTAPENENTEYENTEEEEQASQNETVTQDTNSEDVIIPSTDKNDEPVDEPDNTPEPTTTGGSTKAVVWIAIFGLLVVAITGIVVIRKRKS